MFRNLTIHTIPQMCVTNLVTKKGYHQKKKKKKKKGFMNTLTQYIGLNNFFFFLTFSIVPLETSIAAKTPKKISDTADTVQYFI